MESLKRLQASLDIFLILCTVISVWGQEQEPEVVRKLQSYVLDILNTI